MAVRIIRKIGDEILRKKSREVTTINERICELLDDMTETMYKSDGVGIAAVQVGVLKRIVVIDVGDGPIELINPVFVSQEGEKIDLEGCLSIPGKRGEVKRPSKVVVEALNRAGEKVRIEGQEILAKALCHELDHLDGILFTDKVIRYVESSKEKDDMEE